MKVIQLILFFHLSCLLYGKTTYPNVVFILADDLGIGDISPTNPDCKIKTPHLQKMADEGITFMDAHSSSAVCTPTRYGVLTGRYNWRSRLARGVLSGTSEHLIPADRATVGHLLQKVGYHTQMIGKWHLGHLPEFLPTRHGFDYWFGIPYSNDMDKTETAKKTLSDPRPGAPFPAKGWYEPKSEWFQVPLMRGETVIERGPDQTLLTQRYTEESVDFIRSNRDQPFFLYLSFRMPPTPAARTRDSTRRRPRASARRGEALGPEPGRPQARGARLAASACSRSGDGPRPRRGPAGGREPPRGQGPPGGRRGQGRGARDGAGRRAAQLPLRQAGRPRAERHAGAAVRGRGRAWALRDDDGARTGG